MPHSYHRRALTCAYKAGWRACDVVNCFAFFLDNPDTDAFRIAPSGICSMCPSPVAVERGVSPMRKLLIAGSSVIARLGGPAGAADLARPAPVYAVPPGVAAVFTWTGCYVGGNVGGVWANTGWTDTALGDFGSNTASGALGGAQAGCNYQVGAWVFGIQGDYDWTNINGNGANGIPAAAALGLTDHAQLKSLASVTGRVGFALDRFLGYVRGGGAWVQGDFGFQVAAP